MRLNVFPRNLRNRTYAYDHVCRSRGRRFDMRDWDASRSRAYRQGRPVHTKSRCAATRIGIASRPPLRQEAFGAIPWFPQDSSTSSQPPCYLLERRVAERVRGYICCFPTIDKRGQRLRLYSQLRSVLFAVLVQIARIELVIPDVGVALQTIARPAVWAHRFAFIDDIQEDSRMRCPQRHRRVRAKRGELARGELDHWRGSRQRTQCAPRLVTCVSRVAL
jgi:hypothetical protein